MQQARAARKCLRCPFHRHPSHLCDLHKLTSAPPSVGSSKFLDLEGGCLAATPPPPPPRRGGPPCGSPPPWGAGPRRGRRGPAASGDEGSPLLGQPQPLRAA